MNAEKLDEVLAHHREKRERERDRVIAEFDSDLRALADEVIYQRRAVASFAKALRCAQAGAHSRYSDRDRIGSRENPNLQRCREMTDEELERRRAVIRAAREQANSPREIISESDRPTGAQST
jgi:hypothetical protein